MKFAPHDFPSDEDALLQRVITQASWHGETWQIGIGGTTLENGARATVCQREEGPLIWLTYAGNLERISSSLQEITTIDSEAPFGFRMTFAHAFGHEHWGRGFFLNDQFELRRPGENAHSFLLVSPHAWAVHRELVPSTSTDPWDRVTQFLWSFADEKNYLRESPSSVVIERLKAQISDAASDFNFARTFANLAEEERANLTWPCKRQNIVDMKSVLTWAFLAEDELWIAEASLTWIVDLNGEGGTIYPEDLVHLVDSPALEQARLQVFHFFQPQLDEEAKQKHLCLRFSRTDNISIRVDNPTAHERLEAALNWRGWLQTHYPDEK